MKSAKPNLFSWSMKSLFIILGLFLIGSLNLRAQTNSILAGEITWVQIGTDSFLIKMDLYRDCKADAFDSVEIKVGCETSGQLITTLRIARPNPVDITPTCSTINPDECTRCSDSSCSFPFGFERYTYVSFLDLSATSCCEIRLEYSACCRSMEISNANQGGDFYTYSILNRCLPESDNSPMFSMSSLIMIPINYEANINAFGHDIDKDTAGFPLDSIVYALTNPLMLGTPVNYKPPFDFSKPLSFDGFPDTTLPYPQGFHLNTQTGILHFMPRSVESSIFSVKITQFRNSQYIGEILRNFYVNFYKLPGNYTPEINADAFYKEVFADSTVEFQITTFDADTNDIISLTFEPGFPNSVWETNSGQAGVKRPTASVSWTPNIIHVSQFPYTFRITAKDNFCPIVASVTKEFEIMVMEWIGLEEENLQFQIYPNPVTKNAILSVKGITREINCSISDLQGRLLIRKTLKASDNKIEIPELEAGIYLLEIQSEKFVYRKKLIIR